MVTEWFEESFVVGVVEGKEHILQVGVGEVDCDFGWVQELLFDLLSGHEGKSGENGVVDQLLISHNVTCIECGDGIDKQIVGFFEISDQ